MAITNSDGSIVLSTKIVIDNVKKTINDLRKNFNSLAEQKKAIKDLTNSIQHNQRMVKELSAEYAKLVNRGEQYTEQGRKIEAAIERENEKTKQLRNTISMLGGNSNKAFSSMSDSLKKLGQRIAGIIKSALIFSVIYKVMQAVVKLFKNILMSDEEFRQDWEELKAAFYTAAYPIVNLIVPAIKFIVQQVRDWAVSIGKVAAALQGMSYSELVNQAKASKEAADNYADMEKSSKKTADNVKKQLASFDDIQILSSGNEEEQGAGQYAGFEGLGKYDTSGEKSMLDDLMTAIGGALVAVGLILLFHGQLAWGVGFIIAGAVAGLFGVAIATLSDESVSQKVKDELSNAMLIVGVAAIVLGILLCMAQQWVWGIGLIAVGAASIVTPVALNWDGIKEQLQGSFGGWLALGGAIAIVLGILLCFTPFLPLGIGLIVLGAGAVVAPIVANWDSIKDRISNAFEEVKEWISAYGGLVLGIILLFTGVGTAFGFALIMDSISSLGKGEKPALWDSLLESIKKTWNDIKSYWNANIANVWTLRFWLDLAKIAGNGLINGFELAINGIIGMFEKMINWIVDGLNKISFDIPDWLGGGSFGINLPRANFGRVSIPRLAQGAVIPPNREFLAVLGDQKKGTNIEAPLQTIVDAFNIALQGNANYASGKTEVVLEIDGRELGRAVVEQGDRENRRIGTRLVIA